MIIGWPDHFYLAKISTRCLFLDKKSKEDSTGKIKGKYKLAGIHDGILSNALQVYRFFVGTSQEASCQKELTLEVQPGHWEDVANSHKFTVCTYFDVRNIDVLNQAELLEKMKDGSNGFKYVAKLKYEHFGELQSIAVRLGRAHRPIPKGKVPHILNALIKKSDDVDKIMLQLGL